MRAEPRDASELVDQVHYGETLSVLDGRGDWSYVQAEDHYFGWVRTAEDLEAFPSRHSGFRIVAVPLANTHERPQGTSKLLDRLPAGAWLPIHDQIEDGWMWLPSDSWILLEDTVLYHELPQRPPTADDLLATAEAFLGVPYLWGGTTALGMDCSGYVQQVYRLNGIRLDRDADQQAMEGRPVDQARAGDLLFFGDARVTHVGMSTGDGMFFHAPQTGAFVERGTQGARKLQAIRRYLPDPA